MIERLSRQASKQEEKAIFGSLGDLVRILALGIADGEPKNCFTSAAMATLAQTELQEGVEVVTIKENLSSLSAGIDNWDARRSIRTLKKAGVHIEFQGRMQEDDIGRMLEECAEHTFIAVENYSDGESPHPNKLGLHILGLLGKTPSGDVVYWDAQTYPGLFVTTIENLAHAAGQTYGLCDRRTPNIIRFHF